MKNLNLFVGIFLQGFIRRRISQLVSGEEIEADECDEPKNGWQHGSLNDIFQFDLSSKFAFQIQLPKKLIAIETSFLKNTASGLIYIGPEAVFLIFYPSIG